MKEKTGIELLEEIYNIWLKSKNINNWFVKNEVKIATRLYIELGGMRREIYNIGVWLRLWR